MTTATLQMIRGAMDLDPTISPEEKKAVIDAAKGRARASAEKRPIDNILTVKEVAAIIRATPQTVFRYCRMGLIRRVPGPGARARGISADSVREFMAGKAEKGAAA